MTAVKEKKGEGESPKYLTLQNVRRAYSVFFLALFVVLTGVTDFSEHEGL